MVDSTTSSRPSAIRRWLPFSLKLMAAVALSSGAVYWRWMAPISVESIQVEQADIVSEVMGTGTLEARLKAIISSRISGRIVEVSADLGDKIATGDPLIRLDDGELKQQVEMAKVSVSAAKAALDRFQADKSQAAAVLVQAENDHARIQKLFQSKAASAADLDKSREQVDIATAGISRADAAMVEAQHLELVAQSTLAYHEARLADTVIVAPFSGLIVQRYRDPGAITVPGSPVLSLISIDELWITAWVDETEMSRLAAGQKSRVIFRSEPATSFPGEVARLGREADRETREFTVDVRVLELPDNWAVGQRAEVYVQTDSKKQVAVLPADLLIWRDKIPGVFISADGFAKWTPVKPGIRNQELVEITEGLSVGDIALRATEAAKNSLDGRKVTIR